jgi:preprotein translocase subunit SecA
MDHLRQSVNLRGYGKKNPVQEFKRESFSMFTTLLETINVEMVKALSTLNIEQNDNQQQEQNKSVQQTNIQKKNLVSQRPVRAQKSARLKKIGRNDPCPCGSGKKYKQCHG